MKSGQLSENAGIVADLPVTWSAENYEVFRREWDRNGTVITPQFPAHVFSGFADERLGIATAYELLGASGSAVNPRSALSFPATIAC